MITTADRQALLDRIRDIADWPVPGVTFKDITPLLRDAATFSRAVELLAGSGAGAGPNVGPVDLVVGVEARGFILGAPVAIRLGAGFVPVRKEGKLPSQTSTASYTLEYGATTIEIHRDALKPGERVLVVDDVLATGGTLSATVDLVRAAGAEVARVAVLMELEQLRGRDQLTDVDVQALLTL